MKKSFLVEYVDSSGSIVLLDEYIQDYSDTGCVRLPLDIQSYTCLYCHRTFTSEPCCVCVYCHHVYVMLHYNT